MVTGVAPKPVMQVRLPEPRKSSVRAGGLGNRTPSGVRNHGRGLLRRKDPLMASKRERSVAAAERLRMPSRSHLAPRPVAA
jgi:hypothetical protein